MNCAGENDSSFDSSADLFEGTEDVMEANSGGKAEDSLPVLRIESLGVARCSQKESSQLELSSKTKLSSWIKAGTTLSASHSSDSDNWKLMHLDEDLHGCDGEHCNSNSCLHCNNINKTSQDDSFTGLPNKRHKLCESPIIISDGSNSDVDMDVGVLNISNHSSESLDTKENNVAENVKDGVAGSDFYVYEVNKSFSISSLNCDVESSRNNNNEKDVPRNIKQKGAANNHSAVMNGLNNLSFSKEVSDGGSDRDVEEQRGANGSSNIWRTSVSQRPSPSLLTSPKLICPFCNIHQDSLYLMEVHIDSMHSELHNGDIGEATALNQDYNLFVNNGEDTFHFVCPFCDLDLGDKETLNVHLLIVHEEVKNGQSDDQETCPLCGVTSFSEENMKQHIKTHSGDQTIYGISGFGEASAHAGSSASPVKACPVCTLEMADTDLLISHVESHFNSRHTPGPDIEQASSNKENISVRDATDTQRTLTHHQKTKPSERGNNVLPTSQETLSPSHSRENVSYKRQYEQNLERAVTSGQMSITDYHEQKLLMAETDMMGVDNGSTRTQGLIEKLEHLYRYQSRPGHVVYLCSPTDHYSASYGDKGWGCGYRNFQMLLSCLSRHQLFAQRIFADRNVAIPSIPKIQQMIEMAWRKGFDPQGCRQFRGQLVNTSKWIGATEITACLSSLGIKCHLADFHAPSAPDGTHPRLLEWVSDYFCKRRQGVLPPLYLQHQGHSRIIIGVEKEHGTTKLLLFDPGMPRDQMAVIEREQLSWKHMRTFRRIQTGFRAKQYQIVSVTGLLTGREFEDSKTLKSEQVS